MFRFLVLPEVLIKVPVIVDAVPLPVTVTVPLSVGLAENTAEPVPVSSVKEVANWEDVILPDAVPYSVPCGVDDIEPTAEIAFVEFDILKASDDVDLFLIKKSFDDSSNPKDHLPTPAVFNLISPLLTAARSKYISVAPLDEVITNCLLEDPDIYRLSVNVLSPAIL